MAHLPVLPPSSDTDRALYREHWQALRAYTDRLLDGRCRRTSRFDERVDETLRVFAPLFTAWRMEILFALYVHGPSRFSALKRRLGPISSRVLTDKLADLVAEGFVAKTVEGRRSEYRLLPPGEVVARHLHPLLFYLHNVAR